MAFRQTNPRKLALLLTQGTHEGELKKFFTESKTQLLLRGAKVQNLPHGREERIRAICDKLSRRTDDVLRAWFQKNVSVADPASLDEVLLYLEATFDENEPLPEAEAQLVCRSALVYLFEDEPDAGLLRLLQRPLGAPEPEMVGSSPEHVEQSAEPQADSIAPADDTPLGIPVVQNYQLAELLASIISGDENDIDNALAPFGVRTRALVESLIQLRKGDVDAARAQMSLLSTDGPESELVQSALARARHHRAATNAPFGIRAVIPQPLDDEFEADAYEIIGTYTNESDTGAVFVQPTFLVLDGQLRLLSKYDRDRLFPESGSVMTHKSALRRPLKRRELVHWRVLERDGAEGRTRFHMDAELSQLIEVVRIHVPSSDADEVRNQIKSYAASRRVASGHQVIFVLSDGVAIASPKGGDLARDDAFEKPWQAWVSLETWLIEGHQYCLDLPHGDASHLDLSPLDAAFRRILKNLDAKQRLSISRAQRRELTELLRAHSGGEVEQRAKRIAASLDQISINEEELDEVLELLGSRAEVRQRVDVLIERELKERQVDRAGLQTEIAALRKKKAELEREGREIERKNRVRAESVASSVRDAFDSAIRDGTTALANVEIFQLLAGENTSTTLRESPSAGTDQASDLLRRGALSVSDVKARLSALGINGRQAIILSTLSEVAAKSGVALILKGGLARQCAQILIRQDRDIVGVVDIPMGLTSGDFLRRQMEGLAEAQGVAFLNADISPIEIYGVQLLDTLIEQAMSKDSSHKLMLMSCIDGDLSLPIPTTLRRASLVVDLDSKWDDAELSLDEVDTDAIHLLPGLREKVLEVVSAVEDDFRHYVERALIRAICIVQ